MTGLWHNSVVQYLWQNVFPPSFWTLLGLVAGHVRTHRKLDAHHEDMKQHVSREAGNG